MENELDKLSTVTVSLFGDPSSSIKTQVKDGSSVKASDLHKRVCELLGLAESSYRYFVLVEGCTKPRKRYGLQETIKLPCDDLTLRKWCFDSQAEKTLFDDCIAVQLLCKQANRLMETGDLVVPGSIAKQLQECLDPDFPTETQYLTLCHTVPGYSDVLFHDCVLDEDFNTPLCPTTAVKDSDVTIVLSKFGVRILTSSGFELLDVAWREVLSWSLKSDAVAPKSFQFVFTICGSSSFLQITTTQASFLISVVMELISLNMQETKQTQRYFASDIKKSHGWITYKNLLYDPGVQNPGFDDLSPTLEDESVL